VTTRVLVAASAPLFCLLAIANSAGYRYGVSDLSFYLPAAFERLDPSRFPRDGLLLDVQARLTASDELLAAFFRAGAALGADVPATVYALHIVTLLLLFAGAVLLGSALFQSRWSVAALAAALTLRHAVPRSGVNTLEGYFQPRVLAFSLGVLALAVFVRRGSYAALAVVAAAGVVHPTTALWFAILAGVAGLASERHARGGLSAIALGTALLAAWAVVAGPLEGRMSQMDPAWLGVLADRNYLFPDEWPLYAWTTCVLYVALIGAAIRARGREGAITPRETGLAWGAGALLLVFLLMLPLVRARVAIAVQLQPARLFWILDLLAVISIVGLVELSARRGWRRAPAALAGVLLTFSLARGAYVMTVEFPERGLAQIAELRTPWSDAMRWADEHTAVDSHWLVHPDHTFMYGTSVRVSARRDVFHEASKDPALAMYDRRVAMRVRERAAALGDFNALSRSRALELARLYDLDFLVTEQTLALPLAYRNAQFNVYALR
jgi:hypothetical protein